MKRAIPLAEQPRSGPAGTNEPQSAPLDVFYVVQTTAGLVGERHHRVCPPLYETRRQAQINLVHLQRNDSGGTYSIWKAATYVEPAEWLYDVVVADGSVIRLKDGARGSANALA